MKVSSVMTRGAPIPRPKPSSGTSPSLDHAPQMATPKNYFKKLYIFSGLA